MGSMLPYIAAPWILWDILYIGLITPYVHVQSCSLGCLFLSTRHYLYIECFLNIVTVSKMVPC